MAEPIKSEGFYCPECGLTLGDEDGCCATCGRDCDLGPMYLYDAKQHASVAALTQQLADARRALVTADDMFSNSGPIAAELGPEPKRVDHLSQQIALARSSAQTAQPGRDGNG